MIVSALASVLTLASSGAELSARGLDVAVGCARVDADRLQRQLNLELGPRPARARARLSIACDDDGPAFVLTREHEQPITRAFRWSASHDEPERWLAIAIAQSLVDAGVVADRAPDPLFPTPPPPPATPTDPARAFVAADAGWRWFALGRSGWHGPDARIELGGARGRWTASLAAWGAFGARDRALGRVRVGILGLEAALAERAWAGTASSLWVFGAVGAGVVHADGRTDAPDVTTRTTTGAAATTSIGLRFVRNVGSLSAGAIVRTGIVVGAPTARVSGDDPVRTSGFDAGVSLVLGGWP